MPVMNTQCPYCGHETIANVPDENTKIAKVSRTDASFRHYDSKAGCQNEDCQKQFYVGYD